MILILGGLYQGKLEFATKTFALTEGDVFTCEGEEIDFSYRCIQNLERFAGSHPDPVAYFSARHDAWADSILLLTDISCGVVPMGEENRLCRQKAGRLGQYLAREAAAVYRVFCGLEQRLK